MANEQSDILGSTPANQYVKAFQDALKSSQRKRGFGQTFEDYLRSSQAANRAEDPLEKIKRSLTPPETPEDSDPIDYSRFKSESEPWWNTAIPSAISGLTTLKSASMSSDAANRATEAQERMAMRGLAAETALMGRYGLPLQGYQVGEARKDDVAYKEAPRWLAQGAGKIAQEHFLGNKQLSEEEMDALRVAELPEHLTSTEPVDVGQMIMDEVNKLRAAEQGSGGGSPQWGKGDDPYSAAMAQQAAHYEDPRFQVGKSRAPFQWGRILNTAKDVASIYGLFSGMGLGGGGATAAT